jgi:hypothetical protein
LGQEIPAHVRDGQVHLSISLTPVYWKAERVVSAKGAREGPFDAESCSNPSSKGDFRYKFNTFY